MARARVTQLTVNRRRTAIQPSRHDSGMPPSRECRCVKPTGATDDTRKVGAPGVVVGEGMTVVCAGSSASQAHLDRAERIFEGVGKCMPVDEVHFNAVTALSASGPAYAPTAAQLMEFDEHGTLIGEIGKTARCEVVISPTHNRGYLKLMEGR